MNVSNGLDAATLAVSRTAAEHADDVDRASRIPEEAVRAMQSEGLMGLLVPAAQGGPGRSLSQVASVCHALGQACGSSAMIYAMHQIQVACIVAHGAESDWHRALLRGVAEQQLLLGSVTSEAGTGGNILASVCAVVTAGGRAQLEKQATTISYGSRADVLLITTRRGPAAAANDQVMVVASRDDYDAGPDLRLGCARHARHLQRRFSSSLRRIGGANPAGAVRGYRRADDAAGVAPAVDQRLAGHRDGGHEQGAQLSPPAGARARERLHDGASAGAWGRAAATACRRGCRRRCATTMRYSPSSSRPLPLGFTADMNNLKTTISESCLEAVQHAFMVCGINAYKNGSEFSLGRHVRDLMSAPIMINNDRMLESTGNLLLLQRPALGVL